MAEFGKTITFAAEDALTSVVRFPLWWYTKGLAGTVKSLVDTVRGQAISLGLSVWIRNIFTPMYGRYDWQSRLISVFMRVVQIIGRGIFLCFLVGLCVIAFGLYLVAPVAAVFGTLYHLMGAFI